MSLREEAHDRRDWANIVAKNINHLRDRPQRASPRLGRRAETCPP